MVGSGGCEEGGGEVRGGAGWVWTELTVPLAERTWRGVQIPLPEGIDFVREVVTNHAVSRGTVGKEGRAFPSLHSSPLPSMTSSQFLPYQRHLFKNQLFFFNGLFSSQPYIRFLQPFAQAASSPWNTVP